MRPLVAEVEPTGVGVSPDGGLVWTAAAPPGAPAGGRFVGPLRVWDTRTGEEAFTVGEEWDMGGLGWDMGGAAWSPDGELLAVTARFLVGERTWIAIVDRRGQQVAEIAEGLDYFPHDVQFSPDGEQIVTTRRSKFGSPAQRDGVRVWDWAEGEPVLDIPVWAERVSVNPTGDRLATPDLDSGGGGVLWDAVIGERIASLTGHTENITDIAFSPDGHTVATASLDATVRLWSAESGDQRLVLRGHDAPVGSVAFSPDGSQLVSVSEGEIRVWALDLGDLVEIAESRLTRTLTDAECRQYLHADSCPEA